MELFITKRDGSKVKFDKEKIIRAIMSAMVEVSELDYDIANEIATSIELSSKDTSVTEVEGRVIRELYLHELYKTADAYAEYKARRALARSQSKTERKFLSDEFLGKYKHTQDPFTGELGKFVYYRTYSRPVPLENRRERWWETIARVIEFNYDLQLKAMERKGIHLTSTLQKQLTDEAQEAYDLMYNLKLFPSGRTLWVTICPLFQ